VLCSAHARLFFFYFADFSVDLVARGFGQGVEKFLEAFRVAEFAGEDGVDGHGDGKPYHTDGGVRNMGRRISSWGSSSLESSKWNSLQRILLIDEECASTKFAQQAPRPKRDRVIKT
jgi:hypothetical protein